MLAHNLFVVPEELFEGQKQEMPPAEAIDEFKSELIVAYEQALHKGVSPGCALAAVLDLVSEETQRYAADTGL
jgi:hypothetical protein